MNIDDLKAMLERRGYTRETVTDEQSKLAVGRVLRAFELGKDMWGYEVGTRLQVAWKIDEYLANWQHHMWCIQCHEPLLQTGIQQPNEQVEVLLGVSEAEIAAMKERASGYVYRSAKAGAYSPVLTVCPGCGLELDAQIVVEITD